jgi:hypothetical protein
VSKIASTRCQRHAATTKLAAIRRMPAARNTHVPAVWWRGTKSSKWIFVSRMAKRPALTAMRIQIRAW